MGGGGLGFLGCLLKIGQSVCPADSVVETGRLLLVFSHRQQHMTVTLYFQVALSILKPPSRCTCLIIISKLFFPSSDA